MNRCNLKVLTKETLALSRFCFMAKLVFSGYSKIQGIDGKGFQLL